MCMHSFPKRFTNLKLTGAPGWPSDHALVLEKVWLDPGSS